MTLPESAGTKATCLQLKVCGMRETGNIREILPLQPDWLGFIFYPKSARYAGQTIEAEEIKQLPVTIKKVGVFVNEVFDTILVKVKQYSLDAVQLHGDEPPELCRSLQDAGNLTIIKAFSVDDGFNFDALNPYEGTCHFYLFDTKGQQYGGNGTTFNWDLLTKYAGQTPFFLSGGLDLEHVADIKNLKLPLLRGIDINSRFELSPGLKDIEKVQQFITGIRS